MEEKHNKFMKAAIKEAEKSFSEGGIPIGAVLVFNDLIVGKGHNKLLQSGSVILHGEMDCIENAGRLEGKEYRECTLYTTLSPCQMCSGVILLYKIPEVVIGENETLTGPEDYLKENGVESIHLNLDECKELMNRYITKNPHIWKNELERVGF